MSDRHVVAGEAGITRIAAKSVDTDAGYLTTPSNLLDEALPAVNGPYLLVEPGLRPAFSLAMGSAQRGANMTTAPSIRDRFFLAYIFGGLNKAIGSPMDTGQPSSDAFAAVARHTRPGNLNDLRVMAADGMHLRAVCWHNHANCSLGDVWGAMVRYCNSKDNHSRTPIWMASGQQTPPKQGGDPWQGFRRPNALFRPGAIGMGIDWNDNHSRSAAGVPTGYRIEFGTPDIYHVQWQTKPHGVYWANGDGWKYFGPSYNPEFKKAPFDWAGKFHDLVGNWRGDGSNLIELTMDGKLVATTYMEFPQGIYVDPVDGKSKTAAMQLTMGNQTILHASREVVSASDDDGIPGGWTITM